MIYGGGVIALLLAQVACVGTHEAATRRALAAQGGRREGAATTRRLDLGRGLPAYVAAALARNPEIQAAFARWQASVHRISKARRLPEPTLAFGYFIESIETRVGPQQARISLQQAFPWPTRLSASADAAAAQARAAERRFESQALSVARGVAEAYWALWELRRTRALEREHLDVLRGLAESARARIATGAAMLADVQQLDLAAARLEDRLRGLDEAERARAAELRRVIGLRGSVPVPTHGAPSEAVLPGEGVAELAHAARRHPRIEGAGLKAVAAEAAARAEALDRWPSFTVGTDWIITGEAAQPGVVDSGKDALMLSAGLRLPLWQGSYGESVDAARAEARAEHAEQRALLDRAIAELETTLSQLRDAVRRVALFRTTLVPQAHSAFESVLGAYTVGRAGVAQLLLAQRDLLELRVALDSARSDYARAWARLEEVTGREVIRSDPSPDAPGELSPATPAAPAAGSMSSR